MQLRAALAITRPGNCLLAAVGGLTGLLLAFPFPFPDIYKLVGVPLVIALVAAQGNIRNDLADIELDRIAHPERPLPSGRLDPKEAKALALFLVLLAIPISWIAAGALGTAFVLVNVALLELYERRLKRIGLPGNLAIAYLVASTFLFGALASRPTNGKAGGSLFGYGFVAIAFGMAFLLNVAREILKDIEDARADRGHRRTFPMRVGNARARALAVAATLAAVAFSVRLAMAHAGGPAILATYPGTLLVALADAIALAALVAARKEARAGQRTLKLAMGVATLGFLVTGVTFGIAAYASAT